MNKQYYLMRWILFWVFISFYVIITTMTILSLFFGLGELSSEYKSQLVTTFIIEIGATVAALFYSLFGINKSIGKPKLSDVETDAKLNVTVVKDSPLGTEIHLDKPVEIFDSYDNEIKSIVSSKDFSQQFHPAMLLFTSNDKNYKSKPNVVMQIMDNPLPKINITLSDYMEGVYTFTQEMQSIIGKRHVRVGHSIATHWYRFKITNFLGKKIKSDLELTQLQKIVVSEDLMGVLTVTYSDETQPKDLKLLQDLVDQFGISK